MLDDGDRLLNLAGIALVGFILVGVGAVVIAGLNAGNNSGAPDAEWSLVRVNDSYVQVGHVGGDNVSASELTVTVDGDDRTTDWRGRVGRGDVVTVRAPPNATVRLYWSNAQDERILLETWPNAGATRSLAPVR